ncbi:MAG: hypothetical protein VYD19_10930 [Myxococcota bacterium]|nr:hypothetical protein [Myxococcota bacterium]
MPSSSNFPISVQGTQAPPIGRTMRPILTTITLPDGYVAVGGGAGQVIACTRQ